MLKSYILSTLANFKRNKLTSWLNLVGLAISISVCLILFVYIKRELSYDTSHPHAERLYRLTEVINSGAHIENSASCPYPTMSALVSEYPHLIKSGVRIFDFQIPVKSFKLENGELFNERGIYYTDSTILTMWDIPLILGDKDKALNDPFSIVLSERLAEKYFGREDPIGQIIKLAGQDQLQCTVTGVMGKGGISHFEPEALISMTTVPNIAPFVQQNWVWNPCWTYIQLAEGVSPDQLYAVFPDFVQKHYPQFNRDMITQHLNPVTDIHLDSHREFEMTPNSDWSTVKIFIACGLLLLIIAAINFINLSIVSLSSRHRELSIRKTLGAHQGNIFTQIMVESVGMALLALILGIAIVIAINPLLNQYLSFHMPTSEILSIKVMLLALVSILLLGVISGIYPAVKFSRLEVMHLIKPVIVIGKPRNSLRKLLVVVQFSIATLLLIFTLTARHQLKYMQEAPKGYDGNNVMVLDIMTTPISQRLDGFKQALKGNKDVVSVTVMNDIFGVANNNHEFNHEGMSPGEWKYFPALQVDEEFLTTFQITLLSGRDYDPNKAKEDSTSIIINHTLAEALGYDAQSAIGQRFNSMNGNERIIGVTEDFHNKSLHHAIGPFALDIGSRPGVFNYFAQHMAIRVTSMSPELEKHIEDVWNEFVNNKPFEFTMLNDLTAEAYESELQLQKLLGVFSLLSIFIACLGLLALTWFIAKSKTREIAIRKVLGAGLAHLFAVATKEQMTMVVIALVLGLTGGYFLLDRWLEDFAYRVSQQPATFILVALAALFISLVTTMTMATQTTMRKSSDVLKGD